MDRRIGVQQRIENVAQNLEDEADTARFLPLAIVGWAISWSLVGVLRVFGMRKGDV